MKELRTQIRLPEDLAEKLKEAAEENHRSLNSEMLFRLDRSFHADPDQLDRIESILKRIYPNLS